MKMGAGTHRDRAVLLFFGIIFDDYRHPTPVTLTVAIFFQEGTGQNSYGVVSCDRGGGGTFFGKKGAKRLFLRFILRKIFSS